MADVVQFPNEQPTNRRKKPKLEVNDKGRACATIANFLEVMRTDPHYDNVRFNEISNQAEIYGKDENGDVEIKPWQEANDAASREYIERVYKIHSVSKHDDALKVFFQERRYNPIKDIVESVKWDGKAGRCEEFLIKYLHAADTPYVREVSRLIFAGGIHRLYRPGTKFDVVPILIGLSQGEGKSTVLRLLAIHDRFYTETRNLSGDQKAIESIQGVWIVEIGELAAFKASEMEFIKAFVTQTSDKLRLPYDRRTTDLPRHNIFIGTGNSSQFLTDKSGNRRFFPVVVHGDGYYIGQHEQEIRDYILQAWAEARERYKAGQMSPVPNRELLDDFKQAQEDATVDDWRVGVIRDYIDRRTGNDCASGLFICTKEIWEKALYPDETKPHEMRISDGRAISEILDHIDSLKRSEPRLNRTKLYGPQKTWEKVSEDADSLGELPF